MYVSLLETEHQKADIVRSAGCQESASRTKRVLLACAFGPLPMPAERFHSALHCALRPGRRHSRQLVRGRARFQHTLGAGLSTSRALREAQSTRPGIPHLQRPMDTSPKLVQRADNLAAQGNPKSDILCRLQSGRLGALLPECPSSGGHASHLSTESPQPPSSSWDPPGNTPQSQRQTFSCLHFLFPHLLSSC